MNYLVSIRLMTYNHEKFIRDAMNGILMQKTDFPVEIVVGDDFSKDNTLEIIREYADTKNIHIKILERNKGDEYWHKRQKLGRLYNFVNILENCKGRYIALLDGDDYWTDPLKLQKQVDILEKNQNYSICIHNATVINYRNNEEYLFNKKKIPTTLSVKDVILRSWFSPTASFLFRNHTVHFEVEKNVNGDIVLLFLLSLQGKIYYLDQTMSVYRLFTPTSMSNTVNKKNIYKKKFSFYRQIDKYTQYKFFHFTLLKRIKTYMGYVWRVKIKKEK